MKALLLDTETTGLVKSGLLELDRQAEIIEFYGCMLDLDTGEIGKELDFLIKPRKFPMSDDTIKYSKTKITNEMLETAYPFQSLSVRIAEFIMSAPLVIGHNIAFDKEMLTIEFARSGTHGVRWPRAICTIEQTMMMQGRRLSLTDLHVELFGAPFPEAHRAKADVMALARCCCELRKRRML